MSSNVRDDGALDIKEGIPAFLLSLLDALPRDLSRQQHEALVELLLVLEKEYPPQSHAIVFPNLISLLHPIAKVVPPSLLKLLGRRDGPSRLATELPKGFPPASVATESSAQQAWERVGGFYRSLGRPHEALSIYAALYDHMLVAQEQNAVWYHKGMPLVWIRDCYQDMAHNLTALRYLMLTLVEDAIRGQGRISPDTTGVYWRLVYGGSLSDKDLRRYAAEIHAIYKSNPDQARYPEWVLQKLDRDWITQAPVAQEALVFAANSRYIRSLISQLPDRSGETLEVLADYLLSCMPGCRTTRRVRSASTEYDVVCSMEGFEIDFRSELGRYFVCECKDLNSPANITAMMKFCRVLDSVRARFGVLFSCEGVSGRGEARDAELEQLNFFQSTGKVIIVVTREDLDQLANGANFIGLLRRKYERVRLNLASNARPKRPRSKYPLSSGVPGTQKNAAEKAISKRKR